MARYAYDRLSPLDSSFLYLEDGAGHMHVGSVSTFERGPLGGPDGGVDIDRIREYIRARLHRIPRYRQRLAYVPMTGQAIWVDDERFNLNYHVRHTALPKPGDERQLKRLAARIVSQQLERSKPLWELWIVEGLAGDRIAMISKVHHCMVDGISGVDLLEVVLDVRPEVTEADDPPPFIPRGVPGPAELLIDELARRVLAPSDVVLRALRQPARLLHDVRESLEGLGETLRTGLRLPSETPLNQEIGPYRRFDGLVLDLPAVKEVKDRLGGSLNDVVLATVAGAVRTFLARRHVSTEGLTFRCMVPVSVRRKEERGRLGNKVAAWMADLPIDEPDPRARLARVQAITAELKRSKQALGAEVLSTVTDWTPSTLLALGVRLAHRGLPFNLVVTNVPGPQVPLYLLGARMLDIFPVVPLFGRLGLGIALFSYDGRLFWGLNADWDRIPDLHDFVHALGDSFAELRAACPPAPQRESEAQRPALEREARPLSIASGLA